METRRRVEARFEADRWSGTEWVVTGATLHERLNEPYQLVLDIAVSEPEADASSLLGSPCVLTLVRRTTSLRVCGIVTMVREGTDPGQQTYARLSVEPALSALRHKIDSRIFQGKTVPEILTSVLGEDLGVFGRSVEARLAGTYPAREYTLQYDETDFDFVHRLMEEEGIGYAFEHDGERELLVLFDRPAHFAPIEGEEGSTLRYTTRSDAELDASEGISRFERISRVRPNRVVSRHFDWTHPSVPMVSQAEMSDAAFPALETYVHDAPLTFHGYDHTYGAHNGSDQLRLYSERARRDARLCDGSGSSLAVRPGRRFDLADHPRNDLDGAWAVVASEHRYQGHVGESGDGQDGLGYVSRFTVLPADVPWRPDRFRRRPRIVGVQTATVVGPPGEEIHTDPHGRVKVQFHWDRLGANDDKSSTWIRVMQAMGGAGWGFSFIPRIGMEVVVTFIEGDPDQPLITGVVYNPENPPPYDYPAMKTRTTIKSNSSPTNGGFNELRFEDRAGEEEIYLQGEKDWNTLIKNHHTRKVGNCETQEVVVDRTRLVGHDETVTVKHDRTRLVENNESVTIGVDRTKSIGANEIVTVGQSQTESIGENLAQTIGQNLTQQVAMNAMQTIGMNQVVNVAMSATRSVVADETVRVGGDGKREIGKSLTEKIGADLTQKIRGAMTAMVGTMRNTTVTLMDNLMVGIDANVVAGNSISMTAGDSSIKLEKDGTITIKGKKIVVEGDDEVDVNGGVINLN